MAVKPKITVWARPHWIRFGIVFCVALLTCVSPVATMGLAIGALLDPDEAWRALGGVLVSASALLVGLILSGSVSGKDTQLFSVSPLTLRLYYRRHVERAWPIYVAGCVGVPISVVVLWQYAPDPSIFRWSAGLVISALMAYIATIFAPIALTVWQLDSSVWGLTTRRFQLIITALIYSLLYIVGPLMWFFWRQLLPAFRDGVDTLLAVGSPGYLVLGLLSPASAVAISGVDTHWQREMWALTALWTIIIAIEIRVIVSIVRAQRSPRRFEVEPIRGSIASDVAQWSVPPHSPQTISAEVVESASTLSYSPLLMAEYQLARHSKVWTRGIPALVYNYPRIFIALAWAALYPLLTAWEPAKPLPAFILAAVLYLNFYSGVRWMKGLRINMALPIRLTRVLWETWRARVLYSLLADGLISILIVTSLEGQLWQAAFLTAVLQCIRIAGQFRSYFSLLHGAGCKWVSWVYELPVLFAPIGIIVVFLILFYIAPDALADVNFYWVALVAAIGWTFFGFLLMTFFIRNVDGSLFRFSSSYVPGNDANEAI